MGERFTLSRIFLSITFISATFWFTFSLRGSILALYFRTFGISIVDIGLISMFGSFGFAVFEPILGFLADRISRKKILILGTLGSTIITFLYTLGNNVIHFFILSFLASGAMAGIGVSTRALIATILPSSEKGKSYGLYATLAALGAIPAPLLGGYLAGAVGYHAPFYLGSLIIFSSFVVALTISVKETSNMSEAVSEKETVSDIPKGRFGSLKYFASLGFVIFFFTRFFQTFVMFFSMSILPVYLKESPMFLASEAEIGVILSLARIVSCPMQLISGILSDKFGHKKLTFFGLVSSGVILLFFPMIGNMFQMGVFQVVYSLANVLYMVSMMMLLMDTIPSQYYGTAMGFYGLAEDFGGMAGPLIIGPLYESYGASASVYATSMAFFIDAAFAVASFKVFVKKDTK
jgi:MFS family permease